MPGMTILDLKFDRRRFLQRAGLAVGAGTALPLLGGIGDAASAAAGGPAGADPDQLLEDGRFDEAERGFRRQLRRNPRDAHAAAQIGYIALLSNRFAAAEYHLNRAVDLAPDDSFSMQQLADCFVRQDQPERAAPWFRALGTNAGSAYADLYDAVTGAPWQVHGAQGTRIPMLAVDPLPVVEARVNGGEQKKVFLDTGATLALSRQVAEEAGLQVVSTITGSGGGHTITLSLGIADRFALGDIELRNVPLVWHDAPLPRLPDGSSPAGAVGTTLFYHFLTTLDYANQAFILRRRAPEQLHRFQAEARRARAGRLPLWLAGDHFPCTLGSLRDYGPKVVSLDSGGQRVGVVTTVEIAERAGIQVDFARPELFNGVQVFPILPDRISLGRAVGRDVRGIAGPLLAHNDFKFTAIANFTHNFFRPFAVTFDYLDMNLYIGGAW
jgi:tetratricopeptide (TPR) repeat protein